jgi:hypothetical protein
MKDKEFKKEVKIIRGNKNEYYSQIYADSDYMPIVGMLDNLIESVLLLAKVINTFPSGSE